MPTVRELVTKLGFKVNERDINNAEGRVKKMSMGMKAGILGAVAGILAIGKSAITAAADMEMLTTQFEVMLGSSEKATAMMDELKDFSKATPFQLADLAKNTQQLLSFGVAQEDVMKTLQMLGDTAGGNSEKLTSLSLAYGKVATKGKASLEELNMMAERGLPIFDVLSQQLNVTKEEMFKMVSKGQISAVDITKSFETMTGAGGMFFEGMQKQSMTFEGMISTLKDNVQLVLASVGEAFLPVLKDLALVLTDLVQGPLGDLIKAIMSNLMPVIKFIGDLLGPLFKALLPLFAEFGKITQILINIFTSLFLPVFKVLTPVIKFIVSLFRILGKVMLSLSPLFALLGRIIEALAPILEIILPIITFLIELLINMLIPILNMVTAVIEGVVWVFEKLVQALVWVKDGIMFLWDTFMNFVDWLIEIKNFFTGGKPEKAGRGSIKVDVNNKMPSISDTMKSTSGSSKQTNINMSNQIGITTTGGIGSAAGAKRNMEQAAKSVFSLELQKLIINATG